MQERNATAEKQKNEKKIFDGCACNTFKLEVCTPFLYTVTWRCNLACFI